MIRAVGNKRLYLSDSEFTYFKMIKESIGEEDFRSLFSSDKNGIITTISPPLNRPINVAVIYFMLNVMVNQRLRSIELRVETFLKKVDEPPGAIRLVERVEALERLLEEKDV